MCGEPCAFSACALPFATSERVFLELCSQPRDGHFKGNVCADRVSRNAVCNAACFINVEPRAQPILLSVVISEFKLSR